MGYRGTPRSVLRPKTYWREYVGCDTCGTNSSEPCYDTRTLKFKGTKLEMRNAHKGRSKK